MKEVYEAPNVQEIGSVHELTPASNQGNRLATAFPVQSVLIGCVRGIAKGNGEKRVGRCGG